MRTALARVRDQARVQDRARREGRRIHELVTPVEPDKGLAALPEPSAGDVFFDIEGDAFAGGRRPGVPVRCRGQERRVRRRLGARRGGREGRVRALHRPRHGAVGAASRLPHLPLRRLRDDGGQAPDEPLRHPRGRGRPAAARPGLRRPPPRGPAGVRASVESYSIKRLEPFYGFVRGVDLPAATRAIIRFEVRLESGDAAGAPDDLRARETDQALRGASRSPRHLDRRRLALNRRQARCYIPYPWCLDRR